MSSMKNLSLAAFVFSALLVCCSKKEPADLYPADSPKANYDTTAIDSFSNGATSIDVVRQIRISSKKYQDSVKEALKLQEKEELEKENKNKAQEEKKAEEKNKPKTPEIPSAGETKAEQ